MRKLLRNPISVLLMVILAGWIVYQNVVHPLMNKQPLFTPSLLLPTQPISTDTRGVVLHAPLIWQPNPQDSNPFAIPVFKTQARKSPSKLYKPNNSVSAILYDHQKPLALVNSRLVGVGDKVGNFQVTAIKNNAVILRDGNKEETLYLPKNFRR